MEYDKKEALKKIKKLGWLEYGGKHEESTFTKWFQQIYLTDILNIDKRRMHLSSLICSGEISRQKALNILDNPPIYGLQKRLLHKYVLDKLEIGMKAWNDLLKIDRSHYKDFSSYYSILIRLKNILK